MTTFQLVNHQIKHMLGGIEVQKNSSIQSLEGLQKKITKAMEKAQSSHKKIFQGITAVKSGLIQLNENYLSLFKESKYSGKMVGNIQKQVIGLLQSISQQSLTLSKKMESKAESYLPNLKKIKEKYLECAEEYRHYKQKVELLKKGVQKQSLANIKQDQHERFERNKDKLRNAEKQHDQIFQKISKRYFEYNSEGLKDIYYDYVAISSVFGGGILEVSQKLNKYLCQNFGTREILLTKQLQIHSKSQEKSDQKQQIQSKNQATEHRRLFFQHLIQEKNIISYLKTMMDRQMGKIEATEKISEVFTKKDQPKTKEKSANNFNSFVNHYNTHHLKNIHVPSKLQQMKETDPIQACQDLIEVQQLSEICPSSSCQQQTNYNKQIQFSLENTQILKKKSQQNQQKRKKNLQKFNQICQENKLSKSHSYNLNMKFNEKCHPTLLIPSNNSKKKQIQKNQPTVQAHEFFNFFDSNSKKQVKVTKPQEQLVQLHEHPFNFDLLMVKQQIPSSNISHSKPSNSQLNLQIGKSNSKNQNFQTFDFFSPKLAEISKKMNKNNQLLELKSSEHIESKSHKSKANNFDLLNL